MLINLLVSPLTSEWSTLTIHFLGINLEDIGNRLSIFVFPESFHHHPFFLRNYSFTIAPKCFLLGLLITIYHITPEYSALSECGHMTKTKPMEPSFGIFLNSFSFSGGRIVTIWLLPE